MIVGPAIIDTNVLVAGLLARRADSPTVRIVDGMLVAAFSFVISDALLDEYRTVLLRPRLCRLHGLDTGQIDSILVNIAEHAIVLSPLASLVPSPDPGDQHLWDLLGSHGDVVLVTGDTLLREPGPMQARVLAPQEFVSGWKA